MIFFVSAAITHDLITFLAFVEAIIPNEEDNNEEYSCCKAYTKL